MKPTPLLSIFATPLLNQQLENTAALNKALTELIAAEAAAEPGLSRSNVGGWHSDTAFLLRSDTTITALRARLEPVFDALHRAVADEPEAPVAQPYRLEGWANALDHGGYNSLHSHPNAVWSGAYFVNGNPPAKGNQPFSGRLELVDPRPGASLSYAENTRLYGRCLIDPQPGQLVMFPGWLQHQVHPFFGPGQRLSIAFNLSL